MKKGYAGATEYISRGNSVSIYNEYMSNEALSILKHNPELSDEAIAGAIFLKSKRYALGKEQFGKTFTTTEQNRIEVPSEIPTEQRGLYRATVLAVRSGRTKFNKITKHSSVVAKHVGSDPSDMQVATFGGTSSDLRRLKYAINRSEKCYVYDGGLDKVYEVDKKKLTEWVADSGHGKNAADSFVVSRDSKGNLVYNGWSDKTTFSDIQSNSTLSGEFDSLKTIVTSAKDISEENSLVLDTAVSLLEKTSSEVSDLETKYRDIPKHELKYFRSLTDDVKDRVVGNIKHMDDSLKSSKKNHVEIVRRAAAKSLGKSLQDTTHSDVLKYLSSIGDDKPLTVSESRVVSYISEAERQAFKKNKQELPLRLDTAAMLGDARREVLNRQRATIEHLNEFNIVTRSGATMKLGNYVTKNEVAAALHLDVIKEPKDDNDLDAILKRSTTVVMEGKEVTAESLRKCLNVSGMKEYDEKFRVVTDERFIKDAVGKVSGKVVYAYALDHDGNKIPIAFKEYRSKKGRYGRTANTIKWASDMISCLDSH